MASIALISRASSRRGYVWTRLEMTKTLISPSRRTGRWKGCSSSLLWVTGRAWMRFASSGQAMRGLRPASHQRRSPMALRVRPLAAELRNGRLGADGLLELRQNRLGEELLRDDEFQRPTWELVRKNWTHPRVRHEFADLLREHIDDLLDDLRGRAESGSPGDWRDAWSALKPVIPAEAAGSTTSPGSSRRWSTPAPHCRWQSDRICSASGVRPHRQRPVIPPGFTGSCTPEARMRSASWWERRT